MVKKLSYEVLSCPKCHRVHVDKDQWAHKPHHIHRCEYCKLEWDVGHYSIGISPYPCESYDAATNKFCAKTTLHEGGCDFSREQPFSDYECDLIPSKAEPKP